MIFDWPSFGFGLITGYGIIGSVMIWLLHRLVVINREKYQRILDEARKK